MNKFFWESSLSITRIFVKYVEELTLQGNLNEPLRNQQADEVFYVVGSRVKHVKHLKWICPVLKECGSKNAAVLAVKIPVLSVENYRKKPAIFKKNRKKKVVERKSAIQCEKNLKFS